MQNRVLEHGESLIVTEKVRPRDMLHPITNKKTMVRFQATPTKTLDMPDTADPKIQPTDISFLLQGLSIASSDELQNATEFMKAVIAAREPVRKIALATRDAEIQNNSLPNSSNSLLISETPSQTQTRQNLEGQASWLYPNLGAASTINTPTLIAQIKNGKTFLTSELITDENGNPILPANENY
jgi:hypothetical protein